MPNWITDETPETPEGKAPGPELKADKGGWARSASRYYTPALELGSMAVGGAGGAALGAPGGPLGVGAGALTGAGFGTVAGRRLAHALDIWFGADKTPEERAEGGYDVGGDVGAFLRGAAGEATGGIANRGLNALARLRGVQAMAPRTAGRVLSEAEKSVLPEEAGIIARERGFTPQDVQGAMRRSNIPVLPQASITGQPSLASLEQVVGREAGSPLARILELQRSGAKEAVRGRVDTAIPTSSKAADVARAKITEFNANIESRTAAREAEINAAREQAVARLNAQRKIEAQKAAARNQQLTAQENKALEDRFSREFEATYGQSLVPTEPLQTPLQTIGTKIQSAAEQAEAMSKARFDSDVVGYNQEKFVNAPPAPEINALTEFVAAEKPPVGFSPSSDPEMKIARLVGLGERAEEVGAEGDLPAMDYRALREISSAAGKAARAQAGTPAVASYFKRLKGAAETTIHDMLEQAGGKELSAEYGQLNRLFEAEQVGAFREGTLGTKILPYGKEAGHLKTAPGDIPSLFNNADNVTDLMRGLGVERLSKPSVDPMKVSAGELAAARSATMKTKTPQELLAAGREDAAALLRPYFQYDAAAVYQKAGGGEKGAKAVTRWLRDPTRMNNLQLLGLDKEFAALASKASELESKLGAKSMIGSKIPTEMEKAAKASLVRDTLKLEDPMQMYNFLVGSPNVKSSVADVMRVSSDPVYRSAVKSLVRDGIKADIEAGGLNPFNPELADTPAKIAQSRKLRELLPQVYSKSEISALKDFNTIMRAVDIERTPGFKVRTGIGDESRKLTDAVAAVPMGYKGYWFKHGLLMSIGALGERYDAAALQVLNEAMTDPSKAAAVVAAFRKGDPSRWRRFVVKAYDDQSFAAKIKRRLPAAAVISGAAESVRGPRESAESEPAGSSITADIESVTPRGGWTSKESWSKAGE